MKLWQSELDVNKGLGLKEIQPKISKYLSSNKSFINEYLNQMFRIWNDSVYLENSNCIITT